MSSAASQAYLSTRVSIMAARQLLAPGAIETLARLDLEELAARLDLADLLDAQLGPHAKSRAIEQALIRTLLGELTILTRPMIAAERALVLAWGRRYALFNLKALIRGKLYGLGQADIAEHLYDLPPHLSLADPAVLRAENVLELLRALESGPYAPLARQAREIYEQRRESSALEAAIDQRYYANLARQVLMLPDGNLRPLQVLVGALLDRVSLIWLLRARFSFDLSPSETFFRLVPSFRVMQRDRLMRLVNLETPERVLEALPEPFCSLLAGNPAIAEAQGRLTGYFAAEARAILDRSRSGVARALAYLMLRELDLLALFGLLQARVLGLPVDIGDLAIAARHQS
jgi:V/A-type H+-transporting ATPase subunit C